jgi:Zn-finger nucleic acid-binding protein
MNCRNCAAAMELFDRRRYYFCRYCGTFEFLETAGTDGIHVLERKPDAVPCPLCTAALAKSLLDDIHPVDYCERCRGVLIRRANFADAVYRRRARAAGEGIKPEPIDRRELVRRVSCPSCRVRMEVHPYYGPGNIVIDTCSTCDLIWLDFGELRQIADAPGDDRGRLREHAIATPSERSWSDRSQLDAAAEAGPRAIDLLFDIFAN